MEIELTKEELKDYLLLWLNQNENFGLLIWIDCHQMTLPDLSDAIKELAEDHFLIFHANMIRTLEKAYEEKLIAEPGNDYRYGLYLILTPIAVSFTGKLFISQTSFSKPGVSLENQNHAIFQIVKWEKSRIEEASIRHLVESFRQGWFQDLGWDSLEFYHRSQD